MSLPREIKESLSGSRKTKQAIKMKGTQFQVISNNVQQNINYKDQVLMIFLLKNGTKHVKIRLMYCSHV